MMCSVDHPIVLTSNLACDIVISYFVAHHSIAAFCQLSLFSCLAEGDSSVS